MKELLFIIKRLPNTELAKRLGISRANISIWKKQGRVPRIHLTNLIEIKKEIILKKENWKWN